MNVVTFERIGGSSQFVPREPEDLLQLLTLDPALWAALCAPVSALNGNAGFLQYLDHDGNGLIRVDDVQDGVRFLRQYLKTLDVLRDGTPTLATAELSELDPEAQALAAFAEAQAAELIADGRLALAAISAKLTAVAAGPLKGDGILTREAVAGSGGEALWQEVLPIAKGTPNAAGAVGVTAPQLAKFLTDAQNFLDWARDTERPLFRGGDPVAPYAKYQSLKPKIEEFFSFCQLLQLDPANAARFQLKPDALPVLDIHDPAQVHAALAAAPLAPPAAAAVLPLTGSVNPAYRTALAAFADAFQLSRLDADAWAALKKDFAPYEEYLAKAQGDNIGALGKTRLEELLQSGGDKVLNDLFDRDSRLKSVIGSLKKLEKLILFKQYFLNFVTNFVSFDALFDPHAPSLLQAGNLIMDGRTFRLTLRIGSVAEHKKIAVQSHLCILYVELTPTLPGAAKFYIAAAVTGGDLSRIYVGKPVLFIDFSGRHFSGKVVDLAEGPISFRQTVLAPFRRIAEALGDKIQRWTDFTGIEKKVETAINTGAPPVPAAPPPTARNFLSNGSMMLLAGGLSFAAIGAALGFIVKSAVGIMATISSMSGWTLLGWCAALLILVGGPLSINAILKLRKRNLTLFLEAAGWAVNLPLRLDAAVSRLFTGFGEYPSGAVLRQGKLLIPLEPKKSTFGKRLTSYLLSALLLLCWVLWLRRHSLIRWVIGDTH